MKAIFNFLGNLWALWLAAVFAAILVYALAQGVELLRNWVWLVLAAFSIFAGTMAFIEKKAKWLVLIPSAALPLILTAGLLSPAAVVPFPASISASTEKPNSVQDASNRILDLFFKN